jgi:hypothetical protein
MGVTAFSFILLPLCLVWILQPVRLLQLVVIAGIFEAAAAFTIGGLGVQPGLVPAIAFVGYVGLQTLLGASYPGQSQAWRMLLPFALVVGWALVGAYLLPRVFEEKVYVWPQKSTPPFVLTLLAPSSSNVNQVCYLLLNSAFLLTAAMFVTATRVPLKSLMTCYFVSVYLALGVALWQFGSRISGLPYPDSLFYSNPGWSILTEQNIGAVPRINGSFSEPSSLGGYMAAAVCATGWLMVQGHGQAMIRVLFVAALFGVLISTSTTGFAVLAVITVGMVAYALVSGAARIMAAVAKIALLLLGLGVIVGIAISAFAPGVIANIEVVYTGTVNKQESSSYQDRTSADLDSLEAMLDTYGLGTGWGSNRSSSLIPGLLASVGVPGMLGLIWFGAGLTRAVKRARRMGATPDQMLTIDGCCGAVVGFVLAAVISGPTISSVAFFFLLAVLVGGVARIEADVAARRRLGPVARPPVAAKPSPAAIRVTVGAAGCARDRRMGLAGYLPT